MLLMSACTAPSPTPTEEPEPTQPAVSESPSAAPAPSATATTVPTTPATPPTGAALDTSGWTTYVSEQSGLAIGHPPDWNVDPADRGWTMEADAGNWHSPALEMLWSADGHIYMAAWTVGYAGEVSLTALHRWVDDYCRRPADACGPDSDLRVPLCNGRGSCDLGLMLAGEFPQAFFFDGVQGRRVTVVASGRRSDWPVPGYGDAQQVFEAILSTMDVCRAEDADTRGCDSDTPLAGAATGDPLTTERR